MKADGARAENILIYYVGHGLFTRGDQAYCLAVRSVNEINEGATSIRASDLAGIIKEHAAFLRRYLVFDCCFAASIYKEFQSGALDAARVQIAREFPKRGTALLCSSNAHEPSIAPAGLEHTMFSHALIQALRNGHAGSGPRLSFSELGDIIKENLRDAYPQAWVRPEVHSPDQRAGDIAQIPLFPNPAYRTSQSSPRQVGLEEVSTESDAVDKGSVPLPVGTRVPGGERMRKTDVPSHPFTATNPFLGKPTRRWGTIQEATMDYENWLGSHTSIIKADLELKHRRMAVEPQAFLRGTFYRWLELFPQVCPDLASAPAVLGVGDLNLASFGTWRDQENRLVWGITNFHEAADLPYTSDLVRLAVSARLASESNNLPIQAKAASENILEGYMEGLKAGGKPFVLAEEHRWLRDLTPWILRDPTAFWAKLGSLPRAAAKSVPADVRNSLQAMLPEPGLSYQLVRRVAGVATLGNRRWVALADWRGSKVAREARELAPPATGWRQPEEKVSSRYGEILQRAVRCLDPFLTVRDNWVFRRLSPDCSQVSLAFYSQKEKEINHIFGAMGFETANIHLGTPGSTKRVLSHVNRQPANWLRHAAKDMARVIVSEFQDWLKYLKA
jgi:hypothetical protein